MARPGFVLDVDERTPAVAVPCGDGYRLERLPLGSSVIYPADSLPALPDVRAAVSEAVEHPLGSEPLTARLRPGLRLSVVVDDCSRPVPGMRGPDVRSLVLETVLGLAAAAGVDDVAIVTGNGINRRMTPAELERIVGERVFRSFHADGLLTNHDAEDDKHLSVVGSTAYGDVSVSSRIAESDLVVHVRVVNDDRGAPGVSLATGVGSAATVGQVHGLAGVRSGGAAAEAVGAAVLGALPVFGIDTVLDQEAFPPALEFLGKREWEWHLRDQAAWLGIHRGLTLVPARARRRLLGSLEAPYRPTLVVAGDPAAVHAASRDHLLTQQVVSVPRQADVGIVGVGPQTPFSLESHTNPVLAAWQGLVGVYGATTGRPLVREGGALIVCHPLRPDFSPLHHPSYVDFFAEVLPEGTGADEVAAQAEQRYGDDPWYSHLYRTGFAYGGVHPLHRWYELSAVRAGLGDVIWVGADRASAERLGFRAASNLADALEIVSSTVGRSPAISYLHAPPRVVVDLPAEDA